MLCDARHIRHLDVLAAVATTLAARTSQEEQLTETLRILEERMKMERGTLLLLSADGDALEIGVVRDGGGVRPRSKVQYQRGEGIVGEVLATGESRIIPEVDAEPRFLDRIHGRGERARQSLSFICVPVALERNVLGTLSVDMARQSRPHLEEAERLLRIVASLIAGAVQWRREALAREGALTEENRRLRDELQEVHRPDNLVGDSTPMRSVYTRIRQVAGADTTVLIRGESGTGKELVAAAIHYGSARSLKPFVKVNCAALTESLLESELFGHEKGAFTGALTARAGRFEEAGGGTLFLDEIGDFSSAIQIKLLRAIQEREFQRVGSNQTRRADVRIIAATNRDLEQAMQAGRFRPDLYYRINVFPIHLPPLRDRKEDILQLANHFVDKYASRMGKKVTRISTPAINALIAYHWPGNVRELENGIEHAVLLSRDGVIHGRDLPPTLQMPQFAEGETAGTLPFSVAQLERDMIVDALKRAAGNNSEAARELGISERMVRYKIRSLAIPYDDLFPGKKRRGRRARG